MTGGVVKLKVKLAEDVDTYTIDDVQKDDEGRYFCKITNLLGTKEAHADVKMLGKLIITAEWCTNQYGFDSITCMFNITSGKARLTTQSSVRLSITTHVFNNYHPVIYLYSVISSQLLHR